MDWDRFIAFFKTLGFPATVALWFMWKVQGYLDIQTAQNAQLIELVRQLIEMHRR